MIPCIKFITIQIYIYIFGTFYTLIPDHFLPYRRLSTFPVFFLDSYLCIDYRPQEEASPKKKKIKQEVKEEPAEEAETNGTSEKKKKKKKKSVSEDAPAAEPEPEPEAPKSDKKKKKKRQSEAAEE